MSAAAMAGTLPLVDSLVAPLAPLLNGTETALVALKEEIDAETCELLGPFALAVQAIMGIVVLGSLLLKRAQEKPRRKWKVWLGDVGKQIVGQAFVHSSNVAISDLIARHKLDNPCSLYALNIFVDTTLGVLIVYAFLRLSTYILHHYSPTYKTGYYGNPFKFVFWARQAAVYVACLTMMKVVVLLLFWAFPILFKFANWCLSWLATDEAQVVAVMLVFPIIMNLFQFLIIDSILRSKDPPLEGSLEDGMSTAGDEERGFLEDHQDEEDDYDEDTAMGERNRSRSVGDSGYDTSAVAKGLGKLGREEEEEEDGRGDDSGIGTPINESTMTTARSRSSYAYPPRNGGTSSPTPSNRLSTPKRIVVPVRVVTPGSTRGTPKIVIDEPKDYHNGSPIVSNRQGDKKAEEDDDWGDNSSISSSVSGEEEASDEIEPRRTERGGSLVREVDDFLANEVWSEKVVDRERIGPTKSVEALAIGGEDVDDEDAHEWGL